MAGTIALRAYRAERSVFIPNRHAPRKSVADFGVVGMHEVMFSSRTGVRLRGVYAAPKNGAAIILTHGSQGDRSDVADEAKILADGGFGVLAFDWPGHGESDGKIIWGEPERLALAGALDFVAKQPGVDSARLGAFGFSMGGYIVAQLASQDERLRAVAIAAAPHDAIEQTRWEYRYLGFLSQLPALLAVRLSGMPTSELVPEQVIGKLAPRSLLLVTGDEDPLVPSWMTERLYRAAREPKRLLSVKTAGHGGYATADPKGYAQALVAFFGVLTFATDP